MSEVEEGVNVAEGEKKELNNFYPLLMHQNGERDSWKIGKN